MMGEDHLNHPPDQADFERHVDYIHYNPVKHEHVTRVCDWPYSSLHSYLKNGSLPADWGGDLGKIQGRFGGVIDLSGPPRAQSLSPRRRGSP